MELNSCTCLSVVLLPLYVSVVFALAKSIGNFDYVHVGTSKHTLSVYFPPDSTS